MKLASFDIFDTTLLRLYGRPENINILLAGKEHRQGDAFEREVESKCLFANTEIRDVIRQKRSEGWQIAFISDMYLDSKFLTDILKREGCFEDGDKIYVSCEYDARKDSGTLYDLVRSELYPTEWEHWGDNQQSDIKMAQQKGIVTHYVDNSYRDLASRFVAPAYIPYVLWILQEAKKQDINRLYFISRDGYQLLKIAEALSHEGIELKYFFTSRKALQKALENDADRELTLHYFKQEGLLDANVKCAMVDVGWLGTSRKMINQLLKEVNAQSIPFFYFGTRRDVLGNEYGFYQSYLKKQSFPYYVQLLIESFHSASPYPTTIGYKKEGNCIAPVFPEGETYKETKISVTNTNICKQMLEAFKTCGMPNTENLYQWSQNALDILAYKVVAGDFSPFLELSPFYGQVFVKKLSFIETLLIAFTGQRTTIYNKGSITLTYSSIRLQKLLWSMHCKSCQLRSWLHNLLK